MDGNGKQGREAGEPTTQLLIVCTRCLALRKEALGRATTVCKCGGRRRILRVVHDEPGTEVSPKRGGAKRAGTNGAGPSGADGASNGAGPKRRVGRGSPNGSGKGGRNGRS